MPKKCESCRHFRPAEQFEKSVCQNSRVINTQPYTSRSLMLINTARDICDKEGDGIFVHFEPKTPAAGQAFAKAA